MHRDQLRTMALLSLATFALLAHTSLAGAATLTVSQWGVGYSTINAAIDDAVDGDIVSVEMGIYSEDVDYDGKNITVISTSGPSVTTILGGTTGVRFDNGESADASLDGFTVTGGSYGLYIYNSSPVVRDCVISDNTVYSAYIYYYANPTFEDCTFEDNSGSYPLYLYYYNTAVFTGCTFQNNSATHGGGMYIDSYNDVTVDGCTFLNNTAGSYGGALYSYHSILEITGSHFEGNSGYYGTIALYGGNFGRITVRDNVIFDNDAEYGGAFYTYDTPGYVADNRIVENAANTAGGAFYLDYYTRMTILNNTIVGSLSYGTGSGIHVSHYNNTLLANNVIAHSTNGEGIYTTGSTSRVQMVHNDVYDHADGDYAGYFGDQTGRHGNLSVDPAFVAYSYNGDLADDDFALQEGSGLIDAGAPDFLDADGTVSDIGWGGGDDEMAAPGGHDIVVSLLDNGDYDNLNDALAAANHGDSILVYPGLYRQNVDIQGVDAAVVSLAGPEVTVIAGSTTAVSVDGGEAVSIEGLTVWSEGSYGVYVNNSAPTFTDCWFRYNHSYSVYDYYYSTSTFSGCLFEENSG
jgi:parallel beta-helix repeat protein/predicted outer membrane repeat protein